MIGRSRHTACIWQERQTVLSPTDLLFCEAKASGYIVYLPLRIRGQRESIPSTTSSEGSDSSTPRDRRQPTLSCVGADVSVRPPFWDDTEFVHYISFAWPGKALTLQRWVSSGTFWGRPIGGLPLPRPWNGSPEGASHGRWSCGRAFPGSIGSGQSSWTTTSSPTLTPSISAALPFLTAISR